MVIGPQHTGNSNYGFCHVFSDYLFDTIILVRYGQHLQPINFFCDLSQSLGLTDSFCITEFLYHPEYLHGGQVNVFIWVCLLGFILSFPYILWEIWKFISPAFKNERKKCKGIHLFFLATFLYWSAVWLLYCNSMSVNFVATFKVSDLVLNQFTLDSYIGLVKRPFWQGYFLNYQLLSILDKTGI
jgi:sec-independent protein translocase protein TatC